MNIALLVGGDSSEREVSLGSARQVYDALDHSRYNVYFTDVKGVDWHWDAPDGVRWQVDRNDFSLVPEAGEGERITLDYALVMIHGTPGEDGRMQGYLEMMGVPFSSCDMVATVLTFDKLACKRVVSAAGIPMAADVYIKKGDRVDAVELVGKLGLPMFVKPNASGSSFGVTKVTSAEQIEEAVQRAFGESDAVLAEEFVAGREVGCGVLITAEKEYLFPVTEIIPENDFFDYEAKYTPGKSQEITPGNFSSEVVDELHRMSREAYRACGCRGIVRVDFIVRPDGVPVMIEINSVPGMSAGSIVPKQVAAAGLTLGAVIDEVIRDTYFDRR